eukprot:CAMPEP_0185711688 /NCGR_PEP_ID=MMETSP1164-20130828/33285_1 /TAXON_ID=1104430 /ORGANISM="Chrysoreinhardia sp, Strain CCMP2950" /LENGTH=100 /DNA_ID=CAMNT_0028379231 /DNA_START=1 /DNA_END=300 /DNA_ORIENTATION=+
MGAAASDGRDPDAKYAQPLWTSAISGTVGGAVGVVVGYPFECVKVRLQTGNRERLFSSLFAGIAAPLVGVTPQWALMYWAYFASQASLDRYFGKASDDTL